MGQWGHAHPEGFRRESILASASLWWLLAFLDLWPYNCIFFLSLHMVSSLCPFLCYPLLCPLWGHLSLDLGPTLVQDDFTLRLLGLFTPAKTFMSNRVTLYGSGGTDLLGTTLQPTTPWIPNICLLESGIRPCQIQAFVYRRGSKETGQTIAL